MGTEVLPISRENDPRDGLCGGAVGAVVVSFLSPAPDVLLLLVVEREAEGIAEGGNFSRPCRTPVSSSLTKTTKALGCGLGSNAISQNF